MNAEVSWLMELNVKLGHEEEFRVLMDEMAASARDEPGTLGYVWALNGDGTLCHIHERYADSQAALNHVRAFGEKFAGRFLDMLSVTRFVVYGSPSDEVKEALTSFFPFYMERGGGFTR